MKAATWHLDVAGKQVAVITRPRPVNKAAFDVVLQVDGKELQPDGDAGDDGSDAPTA